MTSAILVLNAGSSSLKFAVYPAQSGDAIAKGAIDGIGGQATCSIESCGGIELPPFAPADGHTHDAAIGWLLQALRSTPDVTITAAGHRVVHGGVSFSNSVIVTPPILDELNTLIPLARNHQPYNLAAIEAVARMWPDLPQVACFDTAFHRSQPDEAQAFALPRELSDAGIRRYGFHGLSYRHIASVLPDHGSEVAEGRVIVAHLGNGASMCAMVGRQSRATTMGFTPLDGLVMGTRPGLLDGGVILHLINERGMAPAELDDLLYHRSGLLGVSGISNDMRTLLASIKPSARRAVDLFVYRAIREIGSLTAAIGGLDTLVFTGGIGERAHQIRARIVAGCGWLGADLDETANNENETVISTSACNVTVLRIATDEEAVIAADTRALT